MYEDKILVCKECGNEFTFTAGEQEFYAERGFQNEPQRCKACRDARKNAARGPREYFTAACAACGGEAQGSLRAQVRPSCLLQRVLRQDARAAGLISSRKKGRPPGALFLFSTLSQMLRSGKEVPGLRR